MTDTISKKFINNIEDINFIDMQIKILKKTITNLQRMNNKYLKENHNILSNNIKLILMLMTYKIKLSDKSILSESDSILNSILD